MSQSPTKHSERPGLNPNISFFRSESTVMNNFEAIMGNNRVWAQTKVDQDPEYFTKLQLLQKPEFLWIGCSDSRVPSSEIVGLRPGELFVHRNMGNMAPPSDVNLLAVVQYAVQVLKVKDIIVAGHYGCEGIKAAFRKYDHGPLESWLSHIRDVKAKYRYELDSKNDEENQNRLAEFNVKEQVYNIAKISFIQQAWKQGRELRIHGLIYSLNDGLLKDMGLTLSKIKHMPQQFRIIQ